MWPIGMSVAVNYFYIERLEQKIIIMKIAVTYMNRPSAICAKSFHVSANLGTVLGSFQICSLYAS